MLVSGTFYTVTVPRGLPVSLLVSPAVSMIRWMDSDLDQVVVIDHIAIRGLPWEHWNMASMSFISVKWCFISMALEASYPDR